MWGHTMSTHRRNRHFHVALDKYLLLRFAPSGLWVLCSVTRPGFKVESARV